MSISRGYVTARYLLGVRSEQELLSGLTEPDAQARALARGLSHPQRQARAQVLAAESVRVLRALEQRRLR